MIPGWQMEAYEKLRTEIVRSAVFDYKKALKKSDRLGVVCDEQRKLERWFMSKWGQLLTGDNGEYIMTKCQETYKCKTPYVKAHGEHAKKRRGMTDEQQKRIYEDFKNGVRYKAILQKYNIGATTLYNIVRRWEK